MNVGQRIEAVNLIVNAVGPIAPDVGEIANDILDAFLDAGWVIVKVPKQCANWSVDGQCLDNENHPGEHIFPTDAVIYAFDQLPAKETP